MMIHFKYNDVDVHMSTEDGHFTMEGTYKKYSWDEIKRKIDNAKKEKYAAFKAVLYGGILGRDLQIVTVTRPVIGSNDRVWITADKKRETTSIKTLYSIGHYDFIAERCEKIKKLNAEINRLNNEIEALEHIERPSPVE